jgi:thymidine kinase
MFSGKSEELIRRLVRADIARLRVVAVKPAIDRRYTASAIASHAGRHWPCAAVERAADLERIVEEHDPTCSGIEEAQFFDDELPAMVRGVVARGVEVICAGLDLDAMGRPFGRCPSSRRGGAAHEALGDLRALRRRGAPLPAADRRRAGALARRPLINVGGSEAYEARCRECFEVPGRPA